MNNTVKGPGGNSDEYTTLTTADLRGTTGKIWADRVAVILILASCMLIRVQLARQVSLEFGLSEP